MARETKVGIEQDGMVFTITFGEDVAPVVYELDPANPVYADMAVFGLVNKVRNACGGVEVTAEIAQARVTLLAEAWKRGEFSVRGGDGTSAPAGGLLAQALANLSGKSLVECIEFVGQLDKKTQAAMRADATVAAEIERIRPKKTAKASGDVASALAAFLG